MLPLWFLFYFGLYRHCEIFSQSVEGPTDLTGQTLDIVLSSGFSLERVVANSCVSYHKAII